MLKKTFFLFLLFATYSQACEISGPAKIIYSSSSSKNNGLKSLNFKNCSDELTNQIYSRLSDFEGILRKRTLMAELPGNIISLKRPIEIKSLITFINEKVDLPKDWKLIDAELVGSNSKSFAIYKNSIVSVDCQYCNNTGLKNLKVEILQHLSGTKSHAWVKASVAVKTQVLSANSVLSVNHQGIRPNSVRRTTIYSTKPEAFFTNRSQLAFYKLNKGIKKNQAIKFSDLSPLNLVRPGQPVKLNLKSGVIKLKGSAIPTRSGRLGEVIQLRSKNSKKIIIGRVTNFNEVEVEL